VKFNFEIRWCFNGRHPEGIDPGLFRLLREIRKNGSLRSAAAVMNISYRHAWGLIRHWTARISRPIVTLEKGRGAKLTSVGEKLLWAEQLIISRLTPELNNLAVEINNELATLIDTNRKQETLRINASHGLAMAHLQTLLSESKIFDLDFHFRGSLESLRELASLRCDIAGFHFPVNEISINLAPLYLQWLSAEKHLLVHVSRRQQGLMIQKNNPLKIKNLHSLVRRSVKFVNRQPESGTRTIFDELLKKENIRKSGISGYQDEEFTHVAVAAMVASGAANAGFGIEAAAAKFGLDFIPVITESYLLAVDRKNPETTIRELIKILKSRKFRSGVAGLPGYDARLAGEIVTFNDVFDNS
jgi:molybdate transport repressor ModE-like protein